MMVRVKVVSRCTLLHLLRQIVGIGLEVMGFRMMKILLALCGMSSLLLLP